MPTGLYWRRFHIGLCVAWDERLAGVWRRRRGLMLESRAWPEGLVILGF